MSHVMIRQKQKPKKRFFNFTLWLVGINVVAYLAMIILISAMGNGVFYEIALQPDSILQGQKLWTIFTSMFMHDPSIFSFHLFANMMSLIFLGGFVERIIGSKRFLALYLISGIIAALFFVSLAFIFGDNLSIPAVGASGAIFGIAGLAAVLVPKMKVYILFIPIAMPMWFAIIFILIIMWIASSAFGLSIANTAHLGGFLTGFFYGFYLRHKYKRQTMIISSHFR